MENIKVEYEDQWWEILPVYTVGMAKAIAPLQTKIVNAAEIKEAIDNEKPIPTMLDAEGNDIGFSITQELVFSATKSWSYGEVTREVFDEIPLAHYFLVAGRIDELSSSLPLVRAADKS